MTILTEKIAEAMMHADHRREDQFPPNSKIKNYYAMAEAALAAMLAEFAQPENVERLAKVAVMAVDRDTYVGCIDDLQWVRIDGSVDFRALIRAILAEMGEMGR